MQGGASSSSHRGRDGAVDLTAGDETDPVAMRCLFCSRSSNQILCGVESDFCIANQLATECHSCGVHGCWSTNPQCAFRRKGHFQRPLVADARTDGMAGPGLFRRRRAVIHRMRTEALVELDGKLFVKGSADGGGCNCLIHTLEQCISMHVPFVADRSWIRSQLLRVFPRVGASAVTSRNYLDLHSHWPAILRFLGVRARELGCDPDNVIRPSSFRVVCVEESMRIVGEEYGTGPITLYLLNESFQHFAPLIERVRT